MKTALAAAAALLLAPALAWSAEVPIKNFPAAGPAPGPAFSAADMAGDTLYVSGTTDTDRATGKPPPDPKDGARLVLNSIKATVEGAGLTMDDLVWVQVMCSNLDYYAAFNEVYRNYFKGPLPARAFLGTDHLLGGAHFEVMGIAVKK